MLAPPSATGAEPQHARCALAAKNRAGLAGYAPGACPRRRRGRPSLTLAPPSATLAEPQPASDATARWCLGARWRSPRRAQLRSSPARALFEHGPRGAPPPAPRGLPRPTLAPPSPPLRALTGKVRARRKSQVSLAVATREPIPRPRPKKKTARIVRCGLSEKTPVATYSPTELPLQYHRPWRA